jgi:hypothetical protein
MLTSIAEMPCLAVFVYGPPQVGLNRGHNDHYAKVIEKVNYALSYHLRSRQPGGTCPNRSHG